MTQYAPEFRPSGGWLQKFMDRHGLRLQIKTAEAQEPPDKYNNMKIVPNIQEVKRSR